MLAAGSLTVTLDDEALRPIRELEEMGRVGLFDEMLDLFQREGQQRLVELHVALAAQRSAPRRTGIAHTLKGEALAWGATDLVDAATQLEDRIHGGHTENLTPTVERLEAYFSATLAALHALRPAAAR